MTTTIAPITTISEVISSIKSMITQSGHYSLTESNLKSVPVQELLSLLKIESLEFDRMVNESENSLNLAGKSALFGANGVDVILFLEQSTNSEHPVNCKISVSTDIAQIVVDGLHIDRLNLSFEYKGGDWIVGGDVQALVLDTAVNLAAIYEKNAEGNSLKLSADVKMKAIDLREMGQLSLSNIELEFTKPTATKVAQVTELEWRIAAEGAIVIPDVLVSDGTLSIFKNEQKSGLIFAPKTAIATIALPPDHHASLELEFNGISLIRSGDAVSREWTFDATAHLSFRDFNEAVQPHLPNHIAMNFIANSQGATLSVNGDIASIEYVIPDVELSDTDRLELGTAAIAITALDIKLGKVVSLDAVLGIGLPSQLNTVFGRQKTEDGKIKQDAEGHSIAAMDFFRTFEPKNPEGSLVELKLSINQTGISIVPETSFIKAIELQKDAEGNPVWHGDFGEYGAINVAVPTFSYSSNSFVAKGGFDVERPLALPLTPIKHLLEAANLHGAAVSIPDILPLNQEINATNFVDQVTKKLEELVAKLGTATVTAEAKQVLETIARSFHSLPTAFTDYLNIKIPQSLKFDIGITPDGSVRFDASVKDGDPAIKLMFPGLMLGLPVLNGITLRSASFGLTAGGNLFLIKIDADVDQFDLASMAIAVGLAELPKNPLPKSKAIQRRLKLNHLVMVMPVEFPIPVPLFYDNIGIEYLGLEELLLNAHAQFPMPSPSFKTVGQLLSNIKGFFTDRNFKLPETPPDGFAPELFSLKQNFLQLPSYLGGNTLGDPVGGPTLTYADIAHLLNGLKTLSVNELIQSIPLTQRVGSTNIAFGPISGGLNWLVTTPDEFHKLAEQQKALTYATLNLNTDAQANAMFSVLPTAATPSEQGMVVFLKGNASIANVASLETVFGLAASGSQGFTTGFQMRGDISSVMALNIAGLVKVNGKTNPAVSLAGSTSLKLATQVNPVFQGDVQITDQSFQCAGNLDIYGLGGKVNLTIDRSQGAFMQGVLNPIDLTVFKLKQATVDVAIRSQKMPTLAIRAAIELLGITNQTDISIGEDASFNFVTAGALFGVFGGRIAASGPKLNSSDRFRVSVVMQGGISLSPITPPTPVSLPVPISPETQQRIQILQQQAAQLQSQIGTIQNQMNQLSQSFVGKFQIQVLQRTRDPLMRQLQAITEQITQLQTKPPQPQQSGIARDFKQELKQEVTQSIAQAIAKSNADLSKAQQDIDSAQRAVNNLNQEIDTARQAVKTRSEQGLATLRIAFNKAKSAVDNAPGPFKFLPQIALNVASAALDAAQRAADSTIIDHDSTVANLLKSPAFGVLNASNQTLGFLKTASTKILQAGNYIAQRGIDSLFLIQSASFDADINNAASGMVEMSIQLSYMDRPSSFRGTFNLKDPTNLKALAQAIVSQIV